MKKIISHLAAFVENPEDYLFHGPNATPINWAFYHARKQGSGLYDPLTILANINTRRQKNGLPLVELLLG